MAYRNHVEAQVARSNRERKICAGCKQVILPPGQYMVARGKNYHEQCAWKCVGGGYGNHRPIEVKTVGWDERER